MTARPPRKPVTPRNAYLVLGMHRSGTSAVTQLLALAGAQLPHNVMPGDEHNAKGYFEPWKVAVFNDQRLRAGGSAWDDVFAFPYKPLPEAAERPWIDLARALVKTEYRNAAHPLLKDPRVTVLLPIWRAALTAMEITPLCVIPVRSPLAVAESLARRDGFPIEKSLLLWTSYMLAAEAYTRDLPRAFVGYDALLADWRGQVSRMEAAHGAPLPKLDDKAAGAIDAFLSPDLRHNEGAGDLAALGWAGELTAKVHGWFAAAAAGKPPKVAVLTEAAATLAARQAEFGMLVSPAACAVDSLRAELAETRGRLEAERDDLAAALDRDRRVLEDGWRADALLWSVENERIDEALTKLLAEFP